MKQSFLTSAQYGQNAVWRYFCGILLAIGLGFVGFRWVGMPLAQRIAPAVVIFNPIVHNSPFWNNVEPVSGDSLETFYISMHVTYLFFCIGVFAAVKYLHQRQVLTLISPTARVSYKRFTIGFCLWFGLATLQALTEFFYNSTAFSWNAEPLAWLTFLPWAIVLTPIQTFTEEFLFRGYLLQGLGLVIRQPLGLILMISLPFALAHFGNPEMQRSAVWIGLTYLLMAIFLTVITLKDDRLELALGVHAANNLFIFLIVNTSDSALPTPALILQHQPTDPRFTLLSLVVAIAIFYGLVFHPRSSFWC